MPLPQHSPLELKYEPSPGRVTPVMPRNVSPVLVTVNCFVSSPLAATGPNSYELGPTVTDAPVSAMAGPADPNSAPQSSTMRHKARRANVGRERTSGER